MIQAGCSFALRLHPWFLFVKENLYVLLIITLTINKLSIIVYCMKTLTLNIKLIEQEMERAGITKKALSKKWKISRQAVWYIFDQKPTSYANKFSKLFNRPAKDFVV